ncbi:MAG TPA: hypothetical protein VEC35_01460 [Noviherbaspirillum sp.]|nr:hypothetical protein [Noviherbaspirillum sp.]
MKATVAIFALVFLAGCAGTYETSGGPAGQTGSAGSMSRGSGQFAPNYPTANPNDPANYLYFGG